MATETKITRTFDFSKVLENIKSDLDAKRKAELDTEMETIRKDIEQIIYIPSRDKIYGVTYSGINCYEFHPKALELAALALNVSYISNDKLASENKWYVKFGPSLDDEIKKTRQRLQKLEYAKLEGIKLMSDSYPLTEM